MIAALDELIPQIPANAKIIPGHGPVSTVADVKKFRGTLDEIVTVVAKNLKAGKTVEQMQQENVLAPYAAWEGGFLKGSDFVATVVKDLQSGPTSKTATSGVVR